MKKYEINRMAVLVEIIAECLGKSAYELLAILESCINKEDFIDIRNVLDEMN